MHCIFNLLGIAIAKIGIMERRVFKRTDAELPVKYYCDRMFYTGTVKNLSENGLFISTINFLPCLDLIELLIPLEDEVSMCYARIRRIIKINDYKFNIGVELLNPPSSYLRYVSRLKSADRTQTLTLSAGSCKTK